MLHAIDLDDPAGARRAAIADAGTQPIVLPDLTRPAPARVRSLRGRAAGAAEMRAALELQAHAPARGPVARMLGRDPLGPLARDAFAAAQAEARVARAIDRLEGWVVLHSLPIGAGEGDLAHLVLGPAGAVVLVSRVSRGRRVRAAGDTFLGAGEPEPALRDAISFREDVASRLGVALGRAVPTASAVVLVGADAASIDRTDVPVLFLDQLARWLGHLPTALEPDEVAELVAAASRADVWRDRPSTELSDPAELEAFRSLEGEVRTARTRRAAWEVGGVATLLIVGFGSAAAGLPATLLHVLGHLVAR
jgi:hypothetical protein